MSIKHLFNENKTIYNLNISLSFRVKVFFLSGSNKLQLYAPDFLLLYEISKVLNKLLVAVG